MSTTGFNELPVIQPSEAAKHFIYLSSEGDDGYVDPSAELGDQMVFAARLRADGQEVPAELMAAIRSTVKDLRDAGEVSVVSQADAYAAAILAMEGIDFATGKRYPAKVAGGILVEQELET